MKKAIECVPPFVRSMYNYDRDKASDESGLRCEDASLTKQSFAEEVDINTIVRRFGVTGELPSGVRAPTFGDFVGVFDFQSAMNVVRQAEESFMAMPAEVRARFNNDPQSFVAFCSDDANRAEAAKLGLVVPPKAVVEAAPLKVEVVAPKAPVEAPKATVEAKVDGLPKT